MLTRKDILEKAYHDCMSEMYAKAQPAANYDEILAGVKDGTIHDSDSSPVYARHYLSAYEFYYILNKYKKAYGIESKWEDYMSVVENYFNGKGMKDVWVDGKDNGYGGKYPGYRSAEDVPNIKVPIRQTLFEELGSSYSRDELDELTNKLAEHSLNYIDWCRNFYRLDREEESFSISVSLGASPTSNPNTAKKYWADNGVDIDIVERNPLIIPILDEYEDYNKFVEYMVDEYGNDWEKYFEDLWNDSKHLTPQELYE